MRHLVEIYPELPLQGKLTGHKGEKENVLDAIKCATTCGQNLSRMGMLLALVKIGVWLGQVGRLSISDNNDAKKGGSNDNT